MNDLLFTTDSSPFSGCTTASSTKSWPPSTKRYCAHSCTRCTPSRLTVCVFPQTGIKRTLFDTAFAAKKENLKYNQVTHLVWDTVVFGSIAAKLGGRVRLMVTGSAPISAEVMDFLRICFSCAVLEGYGQTECVAAATVTNLEELSTGNVGTPLPCNDVKLVDVPDMNYLVMRDTHTRTLIS